MIEIIDDKDSTKEEEEDVDRPRAIADFFKSLRRYPILTREEELELWLKIKATKLKIDAARREFLEFKALVRMREQIGRINRRWRITGNEIPHLQAKKRELQGRLAELYQELQELYNLLVNSNMRLVAKRARKLPNPGMPFLDLVQEGFMGARRAAESFDGDLGFRFTTYATHWIDHFIRRAIQDYSRGVRIPVPRQEILKTYWQTLQKLRTRLGRKPDDDETLEALRAAMPERQVFDTKFLRDLEVDIKKWRQNNSLDERVYDDDGSNPITHKDMLGDCDAVTAEERMILKEQVAWVQEALENNGVQENNGASKPRKRRVLSPIEADVLRWHFGIGCDAEMTLEEIGREKGLTRERIRQIQADALIKLRRAVRRKF